MKNSCWARKRSNKSSFMFNSRFRKGGRGYPRFRNWHRTPKDLHFECPHTKIPSFPSRRSRLWLQTRSLFSWKGPDQSEWSFVIRRVFLDSHLSSENVPVSRKTFRENWCNLHSGKFLFEDYILYDRFGGEPSNSKRVWGRVRVCVKFRRPINEKTIVHSHLKL